MKLLLCTKCNDVFNLIVEKEKTCSCGATVGQYKEDGLFAWYKGDHAIPLAFHNTDVVNAIYYWKKGAKDYDRGLNFEAWCISQSSPRMEKRK